MYCSTENYIYGNSQHFKVDSLGGEQESKVGRSANEIAGEACPSSSALTINTDNESASSSYLSWSSPQEATSSLPQEDICQQRDALGETAAPEEEQVEGVPKEMSAEKHRLSCEDHLVHLGSKRSSAKRKRTSADFLPPKEKLKKRYSRKPALRLQLFKYEHSPQSMGTLDGEASSYEDYFSLDNLKERNSETIPSQAQSPSSPSLFCCRGFSKQERRSILEMSDFSCMTEKPKSINITDSTSKSSYSPEKPASDEGNTFSSPVPLKGTPATKEILGLCMQAGPQLREDIGLEGNNHSYSRYHVKGLSKEARDSVDIKSAPKGVTAPPVPVFSEGETHSHNQSAGDDHNVEKSIEEKESTSTGDSKSR